LAGAGKGLSSGKIGRSERIRTSDPLLPKLGPGIQRELAAGSVSLHVIAKSVT